MIEFQTTNTIPTKEFCTIIPFWQDAGKEIMFQWYPYNCNIDDSKSAYFVYLNYVYLKKDLTSYKISEMVASSYHYEVLCRSKLGQ